MVVSYCLDFFFLITLRTPQGNKQIEGSSFWQALLTPEKQNRLFDGHFDLCGPFFFFLPHLDAKKE